MFEDVVLLSVMVCSFIPVAGFAVVNYDKIANYVIKALYFNPGEGEIIKKGKNNYYVKTPEYDYRLNYIKTPSFDVSVFLFKEDLEIKKKIFGIKEFETLYEGKKIIKMPNHSMGIIDDVFHTKNVKKGKVIGCIKSLTEDTVYFFEIEEGIIDFYKIFSEYDEYDF